MIYDVSDNLGSTRGGILFHTQTAALLKLGLIRDSLFLVFYRKKSVFTIFTLYLASSDLGTVGCPSQAPDRGGLIC